jgi:hypothetical protein
VNPGWAWPSRSDTTLIATSLATSRDAWVWRRSWNRMRGRPSRATWRSNNWVIDSGCTGVPRVLVKIASPKPTGWPVVALLAPPAFADLFGVGVEVDASAAGCSLGWHLDGLALDALAAASDGQAVGGSLPVAPAQSGELAAA